MLRGLTLKFKGLLSYQDFQNRAPGFGFTVQWKSVLVTDMC